MVLRPSRLNPKRLRSWYGRVGVSKLQLQTRIPTAVYNVEGTEENQNCTCTPEWFPSTFSEPFISV